MDAESPACLDAIVVEQREFPLELRGLVHLNAIRSEREHLVLSFKCVADKRTIKEQATADRISRYLVTNYVQHNYKRLFPQRFIAVTSPVTTGWRNFLHCEDSVGIVYLRFFGVPSTQPMVV
jgi:hypothetical protein